MASRAISAQFTFMHIVALMAGHATRGQFLLIGIALVTCVTGDLGMRIS